MADLKIKIKGDANPLKRALGSAKSSISRLGSSMKSAMGSFGGMALGAIATGISAIGVASIRAAAKFETTAVAFKTMLGSAQLSGQVLADLTEFSTKTPFEPAEVYKAARSLLAFGVSADDVIKKVRVLGDISAGTGKDLAELSQIYGKVFVKGKMQAEELNQLSEAGVPIIKELQRQYGATAEEIFKMGSQGKLSFESMESAMSSMTSAGGTFFNMMSEQADTFNGKLSTLSGNWDLFLRNLGNYNLGGGKTVLDSMNEALGLYNWLLKREDPASIAFGSEASQATTAEDIAKLRTLNKLQKDRTDELAKQRKDEAAARIGGAGEKGSGMATGLQMLKSTGTLASLGGDITGSGFTTRIHVQEKQLSELQQIKESVQKMASASGYSFEEMSMWRDQVKDIFKD